MGDKIWCAVRYGMCCSVLVDERDNAEFITVKLLLLGNSTGLVSVYALQMPQNLLRNVFLI